MEPLLDSAERVRTPEDLVAFLETFRILAKETPGPWASGNQSIDDVLEALVAFIEDSLARGNQLNEIGEGGVWAGAARLLAIGANYE